MTRPLLSAACLLVAACSDAGAGDAPAAPTPSERKALAEAAEMLEERRSRAAGTNAAETPAP